MLYTEFLKGTGQPENVWTYKEYERINAIYNQNDRMEKEEAYSLYQQPVRREDLQEIEIEKLRNEKFSLEARISYLEQEVSNLKNQLRTEKEWTATYLEKVKSNLNNALYTLEDKLGIYKKGNE